MIPRLVRAFDTYQGDTRLQRKVVGNRFNIASTCVRNLRPKIVSYRIPVRVPLHVCAHTLFENVFTYITLKHPNDCLTLTVGDVIEGLIRLFSTLDRLNYGMRSPLGVLTHSLLPSRFRLKPHRPFGMK